MSSTNLRDPGVKTGRGWRFIKTVVGVTIGLGVVVAAGTPSLYLSSLRETPEEWFKRADQHVENRELDKALALFQKILEAEPPRQRIYVDAERKIKSIQQLQQLSGGAG